MGVDERHRHLSRRSSSACANTRRPCLGSRWPGAAPSPRARAASAGPSHQRRARWHREPRSFGARLLTAQASALRRAADLRRDRGHRLSHRAVVGTVLPNHPERPFHGPQAKTCSSWSSSRPLLTSRSLRKTRDASEKMDGDGEHGAGFRNGFSRDLGRLERLFRQSPVNPSFSLQESAAGGAVNTYFGFAGLEDAGLRPSCPRIASAPRRAVRGRARLLPAPARNSPGYGRCVPA